MITSSSRRDLIDRLRYTFINADYKEIDVLIAGLQNKSNYEELCEEFFQGCSIDSRGYLVPSGFFSDNAGTVSLLYAMYELLGCSPDTFLLKHRVTRVKFIGKDLTGYFRIPRGLFSLPRIEALIVRGIGISRLPDNVHAAVVVAPNGRVSFVFRDLNRGNTHIHSDNTGDDATSRLLYSVPFDAAKTTDGTTVTVRWSNPAARVSP